MRGEKYQLNETPFSIPVECSSGNILMFYFTKELRKRAFERKFKDYRAQVSTIINSRYRGIYLEADEIAYIDLYTRIETGERRIEILDVFGVVRKLAVGECLTIKAEIK